MSKKYDITKLLEDERLTPDEKKTLKEFKDHTEVFVKSLSDDEIYEDFKEFNISKKKTEKLSRKQIEKLYVFLNVEKALKDIISRQIFIKPVESNPIPSINIDLEEEPKQLVKLEEEAEKQEEQEEQANEDSENEEEISQSKHKLLVQSIILQLGDIIRINAPNDYSLNQKIFFVNYIDPIKIKLVNESDLELVILEINDDGSLTNKKIKSIALLSRLDTPSYAIQNNLITGTWVNIYFGGEVPFVITGEITNLEEDMIEIRTYPDNDTYYINFNYQGIPEDLMIENIEIRQKPENEFVNEEENEEEEEEAEVQREKSRDSEISMVGSDQDEDVEIMELQNMLEKKSKETKEIKEKQIRSNLKEIILDADEIIFGDYLEGIKQVINVDESKQRFSIEVQTQDMLDEMLSHIPASERTPKVLNNIHKTIERFKQLRTKFSIFDKNGNVVKAFLKGVNWKPLIQNLTHLEKSLLWLVLVGKNVKKIYTDGNNDDVNIINLDNNLNEIVEKIQLYKSNTPQDNRYIDFIQSINDDFTPFNNIDIENTDDILNINRVKDNFNVLINNLGDFNSSVIMNSQLESNKFVFGMYNTGLKHLDATSFESSKMIYQMKNLTQPDELYIRSIMTLPEPTIRFSRINLPGTNILVKSNLNLHFLNYWELLKSKNKYLNVENVYIDDLEKKIDFNKDNYSNNIKNYSMIAHDKLSPEEYQGFLDIIIPKTKILFDLMKKYIKNKLSIVEIVSYLEPFLVYPDDLTFMLYKEINRFLEEQTTLYKINYQAKTRIFYLLRKFSRPNNFKNFLLELNPSDEILEKYNFNKEKFVNNIYSNSEILKNIISVDNGNLINIQICISNLPLISPENINSFLEEDEKEINKEIENEKNIGSCPYITISKKYNNIEQLEDDNDKEIYFDKEFDTSPYHIIDEYEKERSKMEPQEFIKFLTEQLEQKHKYSPNVSETIAYTLYNRVKPVSEKDVAILYDSIHNELKYFERLNNKWVVTPEPINKKLIINSNDLLCNINFECNYNEKDITAKLDNGNSSCDSNDLNKDVLIKKSLKDILNQFDKKYVVSKKLLEETFQKDYVYYDSIIDRLKILSYGELMKYNNIQFNIGIDYQFTQELLVSPYAKLRDIILGQSDFVKRQNNIYLFATSFTRHANPHSLDIQTNEPENIYWRYCIKSNIRLLPVFLYTLADVFIHDNNKFKDVLQNIIDTIGTKSDDGSKIVDKVTGSGYVIDYTKFDEDEGYENGFRVQTRNILEEDIGSNLVNSITKQPKLLSDDSKIVLNVVKTLSEFMKINISDSIEFIIKVVENNLNLILPSEKDYNVSIKELKKTKKTPPLSYKDLKNSTIMYLTFGMFMIAIQTTIPNIKSNKTFPGCTKKSFEGYPINNDNEDGLNYLVCIIHKIKSPIEPWNVLQKSKEDIIKNKMKAFIDQYLINQPDVIVRIQEKERYLLEQYSSGIKDNEIPMEHNIINWTNFLPPLVPFHIVELMNITDQFKAKLVQDMKTGNHEQLEKIQIIQSKIIYYSFGIQESIQRIIDKKTLILKNNFQQMYVENACCNENNSNTLDYFIKEDPRIEKFNIIVEDLSKILVDIHFTTKALTMFSKLNTKLEYPPIEKVYSENLIYKAFIHYCKFKTLQPIPEQFLPFCVEKPTYLLSSDTIKQIIQKLKENGKHYDNTMFLRLLQVIGRNNMKELNNTGDISKMSNIQMFKSNIIKDKSNKIFSKDIKKAIMELIENIDSDDFEKTIIKERDPKLMLLNNLLIESNRNMKQELLTFIKGKISTGTFSKIESFIVNLLNWNQDNNTPNLVSNEFLYNKIQFFKNHIYLFVKVFPNIILQSVDHSNVIIPKYWNLSQKDNNQIMGDISKYYLPLKSFYEDKSLTSLFEIVIQEMSILLDIINVTPSYSLNYLEKGYISIFNSRTSSFLFEYYLLKVFKEYINLSKNQLLLNEYKAKYSGLSSTLDDFSEDLKLSSVIDESNEVNDNTETEFLLRKDLDSDETVEDEDRVFRLSSQMMEKVASSDLKLIQNKIGNLLTKYVQFMINNKLYIDNDIQTIKDRIFMFKEKEKELLTNRLDNLTDEEKDVDNILKMNKLGLWNKGLQKGLKSYVKDIDDVDRELENYNKKIESELFKNKDVNDNNLEQYKDDYLEELETTLMIDREINNIGRLNDEYNHDDDIFEEDEEREFYDYDDA
jgi:hypothetical protein